MHAYLMELHILSGERYDSVYARHRVMQIRLRVCKTSCNADTAPCMKDIVSCRYDSVCARHRVVQIRIRKQLGDCRGRLQATGRSPGAIDTDEKKLGDGRG
ncbi:hypothetical protein DPMN_124978 [Dreissena polymorpha]|uniref:Uncharacterized protein n=1 Tax=Dreissena polymorpha TaxID=45954 RepID=A0A9D4GTK9_DREPO|nr:hypothetical protein DPMN_124978 [Dreissena polymorpha]